MLRKIFITAAVIGIPLITWAMLQYAQLPPVTFQTAFAQAEGSSESEQTKKFLVRGTITAPDIHDHEGHGDHEGTEFLMSDEQGKVFKVSYTGKEKIDNLLKTGAKILVVGHVHGTTADSYFHASQAIEKY